MCFVPQPFLHQSRHNHAARRVRGAGGRFLNADEVKALAASQQSGEGGQGSSDQSQPQSQAPGSSTQQANGTAGRQPNGAHASTSTLHQLGGVQNGLGAENGSHAGMQQQQPQQQSPAQQQVRGYAHGSIQPQNGAGPEPQPRTAPQNGQAVAVW